MLIVHSSTKFLILFFFVYEICHFLCLSLMRSSVVQVFSFFRTACGYLRNFDVFIVVPFINSTGLAIVAEADLCCGEFLSEKSCCHKMVVSNSSWYWLLNFSSILTSLKYTATIFGFFIHRGHADCSWWCSVFDFVFLFMKYVIFCVYP